MQRLCFRLIPRVAVPAAVAAVAGYVVIAGASAAAVRAGVMGSAVLVAAVLRRDAQALLSLALTATAMLFLRPTLVRDISFQLSFLGTLGIVLFTPAIEARLRLIPALVREPFAVTIAAQLATLPVVAQNFGVISLVGPLANAVVLPLLPVVMLAGGAGGLVGGWLPWLGYVPLQVAGWVCAYIAAVVHVLGALPLAAAPAPTFPLPLVAGYYLSFGVGLAGYRLRHWCSRPLPWLALLALAVLGVVLALARPDGRLQVVALDVGTGSAVLVQAPHGERVLINGGPDPDRLYQSLGRALPPGARTLQALILSGGSRMEVGGLSDVFARYRVERLYVLEGIDTFSVRQLQHAAARRRIPTQRLGPGTVLHLSGAELEPLAVGEGVAWNVRLGGQAALVAAPQAFDQEDALPAPTAAILVAGGPDRVPPGWLRQPLTLVLQVNRLSRDGLPARGLLRQLQEAPGVRVRRTDQAGNVTLSTDGRDWRVRP